MNYIEFCVVLCIAVQIAARDFSYGGKTGPEQWGQDFNTCKGKHQSPIDIDLLHLKKVKLPGLMLHNFDKTPDSTTITNNGHTVSFTMETKQKATIDGGPFKKPYEFSQLHFHWGDNDTYGSEDSFSGKHFPMELHVVFFKQEYGDVKNAMNHLDGLSVLAFFFKISKVHNPAYEEMSELLQSIITPNTNISFENPPALMDLLTINLHEYYVYNGSLTTPPCLEIVTWLDFYDPIEISHQQLERFRAVEDSDGDPLTHNFRPVQPLGDRIVWFTSDNHHPDDEELHDGIHGQKKKTKKSGSSALRISLSTSFLFFIAFSLLYMH